MTKLHKFDDVRGMDCLLLPEIVDVLVHEKIKFSFDHVDFERSDKI